MVEGTEMMWQDLTEEQKLTAIIEVTKQRDDLKQQLADYRNTIAQQAELLAAHKAEMQDWQRELLMTKQQLAEAQRVTFGHETMSHDITFCASTQCPLIGTCRRAHPPSDISWLSFSNFYEEGRECKSYWPIKERK